MHATTRRTDVTKGYPNRGALAADSQCYRPAWRATTPQCNTISRILISTGSDLADFPRFPGPPRAEASSHNALSSALSSLIDDLIERGRAPAGAPVSSWTARTSGAAAFIPSRFRRAPTWVSRERAGASGLQNRHPIGQSDARPYRRTRFPRYGFCRGGSDTDRSGMVCLPLRPRPVMAANRPRPPGRQPPLPRA